MDEEHPIPADFPSESEWEILEEAFEYYMEGDEELPFWYE